jgi:hypothetical protein
MFFDNDVQSTNLDDKTLDQLTFQAGYLRNTKYL